MVEQLIRNQQVVGSSPIFSSNREPRLAIRIVEVLLFYSHCLTAKVGYEHSVTLSLGVFYYILNVEKCQEKIQKAEKC